MLIRCHWVHNRLRQLGLVHGDYVAAGHDRKSRQQEGSRFPLPFYPRKVSFLVVAYLEFAFVGIAKRFGDAVWKMDIGGRDDDRIWALFDSNDPVKGMFSLLQRFVISHKTKQVVSVS